MAKQQKRFFRKAPSFQPANLDLSISGYSLLFNYLFRWSASIYRLVWIDIVVWLVLYYALNLVYRLALNAHQQETFQNVVEQVGEWSSKIPVTFLLGFFVSNVVSRWWSIYLTIPRMNGPAATLVASIQGKEGSRLRTEIGRYLNLAWVLALWDICGGLQERFATIKELVLEAEGEIVMEQDGGLHVAPESADAPDDFNHLLRECVLPDSGPVAQSLHKLALLNSDPIVRKSCGRIVTRSEFAVFLQRASQAKGNYKPEWFLPIYWALQLSQQGLETGCIRDTFVLESVQAEIQAWSGKIRTLVNYAKRQLPLVYIQVVMVAVYTIYISDVITRQMLNPKLSFERKAKGYYVDYFVPVLAIVHVVFLLGWFKVALVLLDPFGTDEEDFPFSETFSNNLKAVQLQCTSDASLYPVNLGGSVSSEAAEATALQELQLESAQASEKFSTTEAD